MGHGKESFCGQSEEDRGGKTAYQSSRVMGERQQNLLIVDARSGQIRKSATRVHGYPCERGGRIAEEGWCQAGLQGLKHKKFGQRRPKIWPSAGEIMGRSGHRRHRNDIGRRSLADTCCPGRNLSFAYLLSASPPV
jgi:hypothetical protein